MINFHGGKKLLKKRYLFLIFIICLFAVSAVSATEISNDTNDILTIDADISTVNEEIIVEQEKSSRI